MVLGSDPAWVTAKLMCCDLKMGVPPLPSWDDPGDKGLSMGSYREHSAGSSKKRLK